MCFQRHRIRILALAICAGGYPWSDDEPPPSFNILEHVAAACPALRSLWLPFVHGYHLSDLQKLGRRCRHLESLVLSPGGYDMSRSLTFPLASSFVDPHGWAGPVDRNSRYNEFNSVHLGNGVPPGTGKPLSFPKLRVLALSVAAPSLILNCPQLVELSVSGAAP